MSLSTTQFCWEWRRGPPLPVCPSGTHSCFLKQTCSERQYFILLCPFPDQSFQLFIHNTVYIKYQQHVMQKSIKNIAQSQPSACKSQYSYNWLSHYCLYFSQQNKRLKSHISSLPQLAGNRVSTSVHKRHGAAHRDVGSPSLELFNWSHSCGDGDLPCPRLPVSGGDGTLWWSAGEHNFL